MGNRIDLQYKLEEILGSSSVYFQPPASINMSYPCIVYELGGINISKANNKPYIKGKYYTVTLIHKDPDNTVVDELLDSFEYINFVRTFKNDNLYHYVFEVFF